MWWKASKQNQTHSVRIRMFWKENIICQNSLLWSNVTAEVDYDKTGNEEDIKTL